jgi:hypothetical protein
MVRYSSKTNLPCATYNSAFRRVNTKMKEKALLIDRGLPSKKNNKQKEKKRKKQKT